MTIGHWEEVAVLLPSEVGHCDPHVLVDLFGITGWNTCFCGESELSYAIGVHLFRIWSVKGSNIGRFFFLGTFVLNLWSLNFLLGGELSFSFSKKVVFVSLRILWDKLLVSRCLTLAPLLRLLLLLLRHLLSIDIDHIMVCLHRSIESNELTLQSNVHQIHIDVYCVIFY